MKLVGLTGGIASGKSTVSRRLEERGAVHIDADLLAREVVEPGTPALAEIQKRFGDGVISPDGRLDRAALGSIVFADPEALSALNGIVHPAVRQRTGELIAEAGERDPDAIVVYNVPLLVEAQVPHPFDLIVVTHAPRDVRIDRLVRLRGSSEQDARRRVDAQASDEERLARADIVIDTAGSIAHTVQQADVLADKLGLPQRDRGSVSAP
ncbi:dephospho-CoA kinase [Okibacterium fritillariae]|uniref:Dephospho-CoA kinase n=1 Tax=Okibacterium fritillariae TaxID=123320 RepID=A0A1T5JIB9_9MICO|nr:dephospho-CoA kinase [Okibacterium fritillariae]SKC51337.1 dephospho-CoA kinase [Okibacterium fritillariae]